MLLGVLQRVLDITVGMPPPRHSTSPHEYRQGDAGCQVTTHGVGDDTPGQAEAARRRLRAPRGSAKTPSRSSAPRQAGQEPVGDVNLPSGNVDLPSGQRRPRPPSGASTQRPVDGTMGVDHRQRGCGFLVPPESRSRGFLPSGGQCQRACPSSSMDATCTTRCARPRAWDDGSERDAVSVARGRRPRRRRAPSARRDDVGDVDAAPRQTRAHRVQVAQEARRLDGQRLQVQAGGAQ